MIRLTCLDIEIAIANEFDARRNLIVPNISHGLCVHECDLLIVSRAGYATEIEIKVSKTDLLKDAKKKHGHYSDKIQRLYFAIPSVLMRFKDHIPNYAGLLEVGEQGKIIYHRPAPIRHKNKLTSAEMYQVARLGTMRIWTLKKKLSANSRNGGLR